MSRPRKVVPLQKDEPRCAQKDEPRRTRRGLRVPGVTFEDVPGVSTADVPDSRDTAGLASSASPGQQGMGRSPEQSSRHLRWSLRQHQSTVPEGEASSTVVASSTPHKRKSLSPVKRVSTSPSAKQVYSDSDIGKEWSQGPRRGVVTQDKTHPDDNDNDYRDPGYSESRRTRKSN